MRNRSAWLTQVRICPCPIPLAFAICSRSAGVAPLLQQRFHRRHAGGVQLLRIGFSDTRDVSKVRHETPFCLSRSLAPQPSPSRQQRVALGSCSSAWERWPEEGGSRFGTRTPSARARDRRGHLAPIAWICLAALRWPVSRVST